MTGRLVILSGPSGVGKDTVLDAWHAVNPRVQRVIAYTTREPRKGEVDGIDYHFVSRDRFNELIGAGAFLEHKEVFGNGYATPLHDMEAMLAAGKVAILKIDVQGALTAMHLRPDATSIFLMPPSVEELERRIRGRASDSPDVIERRLQKAHDEIAHSGHYGYSVVNENVDRTIAELEAILATSK